MFRKLTIGAPLLGVLMAAALGANQAANGAPFSSALDFGRAPLTQPAGGHGGMIFHGGSGGHGFSGPAFRGGGGSMPHGGPMGQGVGPMLHGGPVPHASGPVPHNGGFVGKPRFYGSGPMGPGSGNPWKQYGGPNHKFVPYHKYSGGDFQFDRRRHRHHHHRFVRGFYWGPDFGYYSDDYYGYGYDQCEWLKERALYTGSRYWWRRYQDCAGNY